MTQGKQTASSPFVVISRDTVLAGTYLNLSWDLHPDGSRFVMVSAGVGLRGDGAILTEVYLVVNWFTELRQRMGGN